MKYLIGITMMLGFIFGMADSESWNAFVWSKVLSVFFFICTYLMVTIWQKHGKEKESAPEI